MVKNVEARVRLAPTTVFHVVFPLFLFDNMAGYLEVAAVTYTEVVYFACNTQSIM
jgi:hypothetical protein